jgi:hypothetical protein
VQDIPRQPKITFQDASKAMDYLIQNNWGKSNGFDAARLEALARGQLS